jgi:hypothetical protein
MLGNLDVDASDDTWTLMMKDREIASGGRYDRLSFTVSKGQLSGIVSENVMDLMGTHSAPYPLAAFEGLVTPDQLKTMTSDPALLKAESTFLQHVFGDRLTSGDSASPSVSTFNDSLRSHSMEFTSIMVGSAVVGMVAMLGVMRFLSPSTSKGHTYATVLDESARHSASSPVIQMEKPLKKIPQQMML